MAYRELKHYRSYVLEIQDWGDTGWAVHAYAPKAEGAPRKVAVTTSHRPGDLPAVVHQAQAAVDVDLADRPRP